jgi:hypothetical protein
MISITDARVASHRAVFQRAGAPTHAVFRGVGAPTQAMLSPALSFVVLLASGVVLGCSEGNSDPLAAAGSNASGSAGTGGGQTGSSGTGGSSATAGTSAGGAAGGGSGGTGPTTEPLILFDFPAAADVEGWQFAFADPIELIPSVAAADAGEVEPQTGVATAEHDTTGDPTGNPGAIRLVLPFAGPSQKISFEGSVGTNEMGVDLSGHSISARISVLSGYSADPMNPPGLKLYVKTGAGFFYADSGYQNIAPGSDWQTFTWGNVSTPQYPTPPYPADFNPADVRQIGIEFDTGAAGTYSTATLLLDTVAVY